MSEPVNFFTSDELSVYANIPKKTIQYWAKRGRITGTKQFGKLYRFEKVKVLEALEDGSFGSDGNSDLPS